MNLAQNLIRIWIFFFIVSPSLALAAPTCLDLFSAARASSTSASSLQNSAHADTATQTVSDPQTLQLLREIYPELTSDQLQQATYDFERARREVLAQRSVELFESDRERIADPDWVRDEIQYMGYANQIGSRNEAGTFSNLTQMLPYFQRLGVTNIYALPFLKSPYGDAGFDVGDYYTVDPRFGGDAAFNTFMKALRRQDGKFQMDLVLNHISETHGWARKALAGDPTFRQYFHILETPPEVLEVERDDEGRPLEALYRERDERGEWRTVRRRVIFPDFADPEHPHYTRRKDAHGRDIWVLHTFYPFQWDLNFSNPALLREVYQLIGHWVNQAVDIFRLDAIPFLFKAQESDPRTVKVVELLSRFVKQVSPRSVIMVEAAQKPETIRRFFGQWTQFHHPISPEPVETTSGAQLAYHFPLMERMWASLLSEDKSYYMQAIEETPELPEGANWGVFLRVHDEYTLEMSDPEVREVAHRYLVETGRGVSFRSGAGVAGRMADFLGGNVARIQMAFALLLSQDGMPIIYYGDEVMARNNPDYADRAAAKRGGKYDARDVNRGSVEAEAYAQAVSQPDSPEGRVFAAIQRMVQLRKERRSLRRGGLRLLQTDRPEVIAYLRAGRQSEKTLVLLNLSDTPQKAKLDLNPIQFDRAQNPELTNLITGEALAIGPEGEIQLAPFEAAWLDLP